MRQQGGYTLIEMLVFLVAIVATCFSGYMLYLMIRVAHKFLGG